MMKKRVSLKTKQRNARRAYLMYLTLLVILVGLLIASRSLSQDESATVIAVEAKTVATPTPTPTTMPTEIPSDNWQHFIVAAQQISAIYDFPEQVVIAQASLESGRGTSRFALERNNYLGIAAYDWNVNNASSFENPEQCLIEYMRIIRKNFPEAWNHRENPDKLLELLVNNSQGKKYATNPDYVSLVKSMKEWNLYAK